MELEGEPTVQGRRCCLSASRQTIAPAWAAGRMRTQLLTEVIALRAKAKALEVGLEVKMPGRTGTFLPARKREGTIAKPQ
jgi:hypothetical protein